MEPSAVATLGGSVEPARLEVDPVPVPAMPDDVAVVDALRVALTGDAGSVRRPGQLRQKIEAALGAENAVRLRPVVHQVVAAAEENLPSHLTRITPLTGTSLQQLSSELAQARGWGGATAQRVTEIWARALGFGPVVDSWPAEMSTPFADAPVFAPQPTSLPPVVASDAAAWPAPRRRYAKRHRTSSSGEPPLGVVYAYSGIPVQALYAALAVFFAGVIVLLLVFNRELGFLYFFLVAIGLRRAVGPGALLASPAGLEFTPYTLIRARPKPDKRFAVSWADVTLREGVVSIFHLDGRKVQVGPFNRQFARAAASYVGSRP